MWQVKLHQLIFKEDFKNIPTFDQKRILKTIDKKLTLDPKAFGKPLIGLLQGYWRLRIEDYRVIYQIIGNEIIVFVVKVGIRKDDQVYREIFQRLKKL